MNTILSMLILAPAPAFCSIPLEPSLSSSRSSALPPSPRLVCSLRSNCDRLRLHRDCGPHSCYGHCCCCRYCCCYCPWPSGCNAAAAAVAQRLEPGLELAHADDLLGGSAAEGGALADDVPRKGRSGIDAGERKHDLTGALLRQGGQQIACESEDRVTSRPNLFDQVHTAIERPRHHRSSEGRQLVRGRSRRRGT